MALDGNIRDEEGHVLAPRTKAANVRTIDTHGSLGALNGVTDAQSLLDSISLKEKTLIGNDANKSVRTIANEQIVATIIAPNPKASLDTLQEIAAWIQQHPDDAAAMNREINTIKNTTIPNLNTTLTNKINGVENSLNTKINTINNTTIPNLQTTLTNNINTRIPYHTGGGLGSCSGGGSYNYCKIATFKIKATYVNRPITMEVSGRGRHTSTIQIIFASANSTDPGLTTFDTDYDICFWLKKTATSTWALYFQYSETWGNCVLHRITGAGAEDVANITINMENVSSVPSGSTQVSRPFKTQADIDSAVAAAKQGNAVVGDVLAGKTFTNATTSGLTGTMPNWTAVGKKYVQEGSADSSKPAFRVVSDSTYGHRYEVAPMMGKWNFDYNNCICIPADTKTIDPVANTSINGGSGLIVGPVDGHALYRVEIAGFRNLAKSTIWQYTQSNTTPVLIGDALFYSKPYDKASHTLSGTDHAFIRYNGVAGWLQANTLIGLPCQSVTVNPSYSDQTITADSNKILQSVTVKAKPKQTNTFVGTWLSNADSDWEIDLGDDHNYRYIEIKHAFADGFWREWYGPQAYYKQGYHISAAYEDVIPASCNNKQDIIVSVCATGVLGESSCFIGTPEITNNASVFSIQVLQNVTNSYVHQDSGNAESNMQLLVFAIRPSSSRRYPDDYREVNVSARVSVSGRFIIAAVYRGSWR